MVGTSSWRQQFKDAMTVEDLDDDGKLSKKEKFLHYVSFPWKVLFALIPPTDYFNGKYIWVSNKRDCHNKVKSYLKLRLRFAYLITIKLCSLFLN